MAANLFAHAKRHRPLLVSPGSGFIEDRFRRICRNDHFHDHPHFRLRPGIMGIRLRPAGCPCLLRCRADPFRPASADGLGEADLKREQAGLGPDNGPLFFLRADRPQRAAPRQLVGLVDLAVRGFRSDGILSLSARTPLRVGIAARAFSTEGRRG